MFLKNYLTATALAVLFSAPVLAEDLPSDHRPVLSPDGETIVFMSTRESGDWELYQIDRDGSNLKKLTEHTGWDGYPAFRPDGKLFTYDREDEGVKRPYIYNLETGETKPFFVMEGVWASVTNWAPDGSKAVMFMEKDKQRDLYYIDANGSNPQQLTDTPERNEHEGHFSPDGTKLAYATQTDQGSGLEVLDLETGSVVRFVESTQYLYGLSWSPDGTRIAYVDTPNDNPDGNAELYTLNVVTGDVTQLTRNEDYDHMPVWLGDSRIMFTSYASGREEIYILDLASGETNKFDTGLE